jgi:hypothetical protein
MLKAYRHVGLPAELIKIGIAGHDFEPAAAGQTICIPVEQIHALTVDVFSQNLLARAP